MVVELFHKYKPPTLELSKTLIVNGKLLPQVNEVSFVLALYINPGELLVKDVPVPPKFNGTIPVIPLLVTKLGNISPVLPIYFQKDIYKYV